MRLYHGTSESKLKAILKDGIKPRGKKDGNWKRTVKSNPTAVYLTDAYPLHFAMASAKGKERLVILEIDTEALNYFKFAPDEDCLEQGTRKDPNFENVPGTEPFNMKKRTQWFRDRALKQFSHLWRKSLEMMGTCTYYGDIPPEAITRYSLVNNTIEVILAADPVICPLNYKILGPYYRQLTRMLFGEKPDLHDLYGRDADILTKMHNHPEGTMLEGMEVVNITPSAPLDEKVA